MDCSRLYDRAAQFRSFVAISWPSFPRMTHSDGLEAKGPRKAVKKAAQRTRAAFNVSKIARYS